MIFMVVETFRNQDAKAVYRRLREKETALTRQTVHRIKDGVAAASVACGDIQRTMSISNNLVRRHHVTPEPLAQARRRTL